MNFNTNFNYFFKRTSMFLPKSYYPTVSSHLFVFTSIVPFAKNISPISTAKLPSILQGSLVCFWGKTPWTKNQQSEVNSTSSDTGQLWKL